MIGGLYDFGLLMKSIWAVDGHAFIGFFGCSLGGFIASDLKS
jgi:hypothetical protein